MKSLIRVVCLAAAFYLIGDAFIVRGPVHRWLHSALSTEAKNTAARVSGHPISNSQLERAVIAQLWLEGKAPASVPPAELKLTRKIALDELIDHELLRLRVKAASPPITVSDADIDIRQQRLIKRFESKAVLETAMKSQGIVKERDLRERIAGQIQQEKYIARCIQSSVKVSDDEARKWFQENQESISLRERIEARHIFIATLEHPPEEAKQKLDAALVELTEKKKDFASLAKELSEDPATKDSGGALGWMTHDRLPADFAAPVFSLEMLRPTLVRSRLGWHIVEVTARKAAESRTFEQAKPEILSALETIKLRQAVEDFRKDLRKSEAANIEILAAGLH